jgi:hypothetical protein
MRFLLALSPVISIHSCDCQSDKSPCFPAISIPYLYNAHGIANHGSKKIITEATLFTLVVVGMQ